MIKRRTLKTLGLVVALALMMSVWGCTPKAPADADVVVEPIKIGGIFPTTGTCAQPGTGCKYAMELAIEEINEAGGIHGRPIELIFEDDEGQPAVSVAAAEKLCVQDQVVGVIGAFNSSCVLAHMQVTQREGVPQVDPVAFAYDITRSGNPYMFRNLPQASLLGEKFAEFMLEETGGAKTWAFIRENTDYGLDYRKYIGERLEKEAEILTTETYNPGDTDFYAQLTKIKNLNPEGVVMVANLAEGSQIMKQYRELNIDIPIFATGSSATQQFRDLTGDAANGLYSLSFLENTEATSAIAREFIKNYDEKYGFEPDYFAAATYDAVYIFKEGIENAYAANGNKWFDDLKSFRDAIRDGIAAIDGLVGVQGEVIFNEYGEASTDIYWIQWIEGGGKRVIDILPAAENVIN